MKEDRLEDILLDAGLINSNQINKPKATHEPRIDGIEKTMVNDTIDNYKQTMMQAARKKGVDFIDLENIKINKEAVLKLNPQISRKYFVFPFDIKDRYLCIAMDNPDDVFAIDELRILAQMDIKPYYADKRMIAKAITYFYKPEVEQTQPQQQPMQQQPLQQQPLQQQPIQQPQQPPQNNSFIMPAPERKRQPEAHETVQTLRHSGEPSAHELEDFIRGLILKAIRIDATDIHLDSANKALRVRYRVDGKLTNDTNKVLLNPDSVISRIKVMAGLFTCDKTVPQRGRISYDLNKKEKIFLETLTLPTISGEKLLLKLENTHTAIDINELGFTQFEKDTIDAMLKRKSGMIIVSGLHSSGKTNTVYSLIKRIVSDDLNIITLEKKIAEKIDGINQLQVPDGADTNEGFIKSVIEHDPDVLIVDFVVDSNIIGTLINTALSGKLVILTQLFPSVYDTISGLISMGIEPYLIGASLEGVIAQQLLRKLCNSCKDRLSAAHTSDMEDNKEEICEVCNNTGYKGKTGVFEVFSMTKEYRKLISRSVNLSELEDGLEKEVSTFENNCKRLISEGITSMDEVLRSGFGKSMF